MSGTQEAAGTEYPKIYGPYARFTDPPRRNQLDVSTLMRPEFQVLWDAEWTWTEKVDGTNIRVVWDGHRVDFGGRTDNALIPAALVSVLRTMFPEELMEQQFGAGAAVLYGEGYGAKIQKGGGNYRPDPSFALFDVKVGGWWLLPDSVNQVAAQLGIAVVPHRLLGSVGEAIDLVRGDLLSSWGPFRAEGLVGRPPLGIMGRDGDRLLMKIKTKDFQIQAK